MKKKKRSYYELYVCKLWVRNSKFKDIKYKPFPLPNLEISDAIINSNYNIANFKSKKLIIYPKFFSIYNYSNFQVRKIKLRNSDLEVNPKNIDSLSETIINLEKKIFLKRFKY